MPKILNGKRRKEDLAGEQLQMELYREIGQLKVELDWLKKHRACSDEERRSWIEPGEERITVGRQCELAGAARSSWYYRSQRDSSYDEELMRLIDKEYTRQPFYGTRRITGWLRQQGRRVNRKRVVRLMAEMGLAAIYPRQSFSHPAEGRQVFPYLGVTLI